MRICTLGRCSVAVAFVLFACGLMFAGVTASISGTVKDPSGASIIAANVTATNI